jgi:hypothetical protein
VLKWQCALGREMHVRRMGCAGVCVCVCVCVAASLLASCRLAADCFVSNSGNGDRTTRGHHTDLLLLGRGGGGLGSCARWERQEQVRAGGRGLG